MKIEPDTLAWLLYGYGLFMAFVFVVTMVVQFAAALLPAVLENLPASQLPMFVGIGAAGAVCVGMIGVPLAGLPLWAGLSIRRRAKHAYILAMVAFAFALTNFPIGLIVGLVGIFGLIHPETRAALETPLPQDNDSVL